MSLPATPAAIALPAVAPWQRRALRLGTAVAQPFAGLPLVLRDPTYRPMCLWFLCAGANGGLWLNFLPLWLAQNLGATPAQIGWFFSANFLAAALGNLTMPPLADRLRNPRRVALVLLTIGVPGTLGMAFANGYWMALIAITPLWFGIAVFSLLTGLAGDTARARATAGERDQTGTVVGALQVAFGIGSTATPLLGGWIYQATGELRPAILLGLIPASIATWLVWRPISFPSPAPPPAPAGPGTIDPTEAAGPRSGTVDAPSRLSRALLLRGAGLALPLFLAAQLLFKLSDSRGPFESLFAAEEMGASRAAVGVLATLGAGLALALTPLAGALVDRFGAGTVTALGMALAGLHGLLLSTIGAFWQQLAILVVVQAALAIGASAPVIYAQHLAPGRAATATGWANACIFLGLCAGNPLSGRIVELAGFRGLFLFSGTVDLLGAALVGLLVFRTTRR